MSEVATWQPFDETDFETGDPRATIPKFIPRTKRTYSSIDKLATTKTRIIRYGSLL